MRIPNLFQETKEAQRLYSMLLLRLTIHERNEEVVKVARKIRRHARNSIGIKSGLFTYWYERTALWDLGLHSVGWRQQLRFETGWYGQPVDLLNPAVEDIVRYQIAEQRASLHFACRRFSDAANCQEIVLSKLNGDDLFYKVTNRDQAPTHPARVTLRHIYEGLEKSLTSWAGWNDFVSGIGQPLLKYAAVSRRSLRAAPDLLTTLDAAIVERRRTIKTEESPPRPVTFPWENELLRWFPFLKEFPRT